ncbi:hypothetical protein DFH29DRAFT_877289 [Suillus ampliporus]|nr:hypothetical protein DFH29DRAFT_877289 [Suillus ampliporus]
MAYHRKTVDYGMKMSSLMSAPYINDIHTMDQLTDHELNHLIVKEEEPPDNADEGPLSHMLAWIFRSFMVEVPDVTELKVPLHKIHYCNHRLHSKFALTDKHDLVPLFNKDEQQWNWVLPISHLNGPCIDWIEEITGDGLGVKNEMSGGGISDSLLEGPSVSASQAQKHLFEEIFTSFFNTVCGVLAQPQPKIMTANSMVVHTWSLANATHAVKDEEVQQKPDLALLDDVTARWDTIKAVCKLMLQLYLPQSTVGKTIDSKAYFLLRHQPWRWFVLLLSLTNKYCDLQVHMYDHSGGVVMPHINIVSNLNFYLHVLSCLVFGNPKCIGYDPSILIFMKMLQSAQLENSPTFLCTTTNKLPAADQTCRSLAESMVDEAIQVESTAPPQIRSATPAIPNAPGLIGHGMVCYLARRDDEEYIIKDHWVLGDKDITLNEIWKSIKGTSHTHVPNKSRAGEKYSIRGTGTLPFMSHSLLFQLSEAVGSQKHTSRSHAKGFAWRETGNGCCICGPANSFKEGGNAKTTFFFHPHADKLREQFHPYFHDLLPLVVEWYKLIRGKGPSQVMMFKEVINLLTKHLDILPKDEPSLELLFAWKVIGGLPDGLPGRKRKAPSKGSGSLDNGTCALAKVVQNYLVYLLHFKLY